MTEHNPEVDPTPSEPSHKAEVSDENAKSSSSSVEFSLDETNTDYLKGVFLRQARSLQKDFVELYKEDPKATYRLTLERL